MRLRHREQIAAFGPCPVQNGFIWCWLHTEREGA
jgi:hypothetical protein